MLEKLKKYLSDVSVELKKVTWPTMEELKGHTLIVFAVTGIFTVVVFLFDTVFSNAVQMLIKQ